MKNYNVLFTQGPTQAEAIIAADSAADAGELAAKQIPAELNGILDIEIWVSSPENTSNILFHSEVKI